MHYCGVVMLQRDLQLALLEEVRDPEPPIRLSALFYEPGSAERVADELRTLGDVVVGLGPGAEPVAEAAGMPFFQPEEDGEVPEGAYSETPLFPTDPDRVFWALQGRRLPAKRHPYGIQLRIEEPSGTGSPTRAGTSGTGASRRSTPWRARCARTASRSVTRRSWTASCCPEPACPMSSRPAA